MMFKPPIPSYVLTGGIAINWAPGISVMKMIQIRIAAKNLEQLLFFPPADESIRHVSLDSALRRTESDTTFDDGLVGSWAI